jgi:hypothetical protein
VEDNELPLQKNRSHSEEKILMDLKNSQNGSTDGVNKLKSKKKKDRKGKKEPWTYNGYTLGNLQYQAPPQYYGQDGQYINQDYYCDYNMGQAPQMQYGQGVQDQQYYPAPWYQQQGSENAPGGPLTSYDYSHYQSYDQGYSQQYYQDPNAYQAASYDSGSRSQSYVVPVTGECHQSAYVPGLPPGAKLVAEYFLGYLDEQSQQQQYANQDYYNQQYYAQNYGQQYYNNNQGYSTNQSASER